MKRRVCDNPHVRPYTADGVIEAADREIERLREALRVILEVAYGECQCKNVALHALRTAPPAKAEKEG